MNFIEINVMGRKQLLNVEAIKQVYPGGGGGSSITLRESGDSKIGYIQANETPEQIEQLLAIAGARVSRL